MEELFIDELSLEGHPRNDSLKTVDDWSQYNINSKWNQFDLLDTISPMSVSSSRACTSKNMQIVSYIWEEFNFSGLI